jgi:hypothetical protein
MPERLQPLKQQLGLAHSARRERQVGFIVLAAVAFGVLFVGLLRFLGLASVQIPGLGLRVSSLGTLAGVVVATLFERVAERHRPEWFRAGRASTSRPSA